MNKYIQFPKHIVTSSSLVSIIQTQLLQCAFLSQPNCPLRVVQRERHVPLAGAARARGREAPRGTHGPRGADALLPPAFRDVECGAALDGGELELGRAGLAGRAGWRAAALGDGPRDAAADAEYGYVLIVEDDVPGGL